MLESINIIASVVIGLISAIGTVAGVLVVMKQDRVKKETVANEWRTNMDKFVESLKNEMATLTKGIEKLQKSIDETDENAEEHTAKLIRIERDIELIEEVKDNIRTILKSITDLGLIIAKHSEKLDRVEKDVDNLYKKGK